MSSLEFSFELESLFNEVENDEPIPFEVFKNITFGLNNEPHEYEFYNSPLNILDGEIDYDHNNLGSKKYYNCSEISNLFDNRFSVIFSNIRSFSKIFLYFQHSYLYSFANPPKIVGLCETKIDKQTESIYSCFGYNLVFNSNNANKGGLMFLIENNIKYEVLNEITFSCEDVESLFIKVFSDFGNLFVGIIYRRPNSDFDTFMEKYECILQYLGNRKSVIGGDFNLNLANYQNSNFVKQYVETSFEFSYRSLINNPTRVTSHSATIIDHLWLNFTCSSMTSGIILTDASDHFSTFIALDFHAYSNPTDDKYKFRNINGVVVDSFRDDLLARVENINFELYLSDPDFLINKLIYCIKEVMNIHCPLQTKLKRRMNKNPWFTPELHNLTKEKNKLYKKFTRRPITYGPEYRSIRNRLNNAIDYAKKVYYQNKLNHSQNSAKKSWDVLNEILNRSQKKSLCNSLLIDNNFSNDSNLIVNHFNQFFSTIGESIASSVGPSTRHFSDFLNGVYHDSLLLTPVTLDELLKAMCSLNPSSSGSDDISGKILQICAPIIAYPLLIIFNQCFVAGIFPACLKISKIIPLHKSNDPTLVNNYRPISLLSSISKLFEKIIYQRLYNFFDEREILVKEQSGFRKGYSVNVSIARLLKNVVEGIDSGNFGLCVFLDLKKAFDLVNHNILLKKLHFYGIRGIANNLIKSYLSNRSSFVSLNGVDSRLSEISIGVPQGSTLGPLLFLVYINDIVNSSHLFKFNLFADDTSIFYMDKNLTTLYSTVNAELELVADWVKANKLCLNTTKTVYLLFHGKRNTGPLPPLFLGNEEIERKSVVKFLGIFLDDKLKWKTQIDHISDKLSKMLGILYKVRNCFTSSALKTFYYSFVFPYLQYGLIFWGSSCKKQFNRVLILQKKIIRCINYQGKFAQTEPLFKKYEINFRTLKIFKFVNLYTYDINSHQFFNFHTHASIHEYPTRNSSNLVQSLVHSSLASNFILNKGLILFNSLENHVKTARNIDIFKSRLRNYYLSSYSTE